jgi:EAL domain-containing protein (putative c-di-GMP-specific phosphodiesterase class I)
MYQLEDESLAGFEALSRFSPHPLRTPDQWFAEADEVGLGVDLEFVAVQAACTGLPVSPATISHCLNLSPRAILSPRFKELFEMLTVERLVLEAGEALDFIVHDVLDLAEYTDLGVVVTLVDAQAGRVRLHLKIGMGELLCERIANALECRYGENS